MSRRRISRLARAAALTHIQTSPPSVTTQAVLLIISTEVGRSSPSGDHREGTIPIDRHERAGVRLRRSPLDTD